MHVCVHICMCVYILYIHVWMSKTCIDTTICYRTSGAEIFNTKATSDFMGRELLESLLTRASSHHGLCP